MIYLNRENIRGQIFWHDKIASQFQIEHQPVFDLMKELRHDNYISYPVGKDYTEEFNNQKNPTLTESGRQFIENGGYGGRLSLDVQHEIDYIKEANAQRSGEIPQKGKGKKGSFLDKWDAFWGFFEKPANAIIAMSGAVVIIGGIIVWLRSCAGPSANKQEPTEGKDSLQQEQTSIRDTTKL